MMDEHHCNCFFVPDGAERAKLLEKLNRIGAYDQRIQEHHGQRWGTTYVLDDYWQLHVKMMPTGIIECEAEARIRLVEHHTMKSKPAHIEIQQLLEKFRIRYGFVTPTPDPCKNRTLNTPSNPTDIGALAIAFALAGLIVFGTIALIAMAVAYVRSRKK